MYPFIYIIWCLYLYTGALLDLHCLVRSAEALAGATELHCPPFEGPRGIRQGSALSQLELSVDVHGVRRFQMAPLSSFQQIGWHLKG